MAAQNIRDLVSRNQWEAVFRALREIESNDENWGNQVVQLESRYRYLKLQKGQGVLTTAEVNLEFNRLRESILSLVEDLPPQPATSIFSQQNILIMSVVLAVIIALLYLSQCPKVHSINNSAQTVDTQPYKPVNPSNPTESKASGKASNVGTNTTGTKEIGGKKEEKSVNKPPVYGPSLSSIKENVDKTPPVDPSKQESIKPSPMVRLTLVVNSDLSEKDITVDGQPANVESNGLTIKKILVKANSNHIIFVGECKQPIYVQTTEKTLNFTCNQ